MAEHDEDDDDQGERRANGANGGDDLPDDPAELKKLLAQERRTMSRMANELKPLKKARADLSESLLKWSRIAEKHGLDPDSLDRTLSEREERDLQRARDNGGEEAQQMIENLRQKHTRELAALHGEIERHKTLLQGVLIDDRLNMGLAKYVDTSKPGLLDGAFEILRKKVRVVEDADAPRGYSPVVNVDGADMPLEEYLEQWADTDPKAQPYLKQSQATGGGAAGGTGRPSKQLFKSRMTPKEMSDFIEAHGGGAAGLAAFQALPRAPAPGQTR